MKNFKLIGAAAGALLLVVILYVVFGRGVSASDVIKRAEQQLALLQSVADVKVDKIEADTDDNAVIYTGVTVGYKAMPGFALKIESLVESGIDDDTYEGNPGNITSIESIASKNVSVLLEGVQVASIAEYSLNGVRCNFRDFLKLLGDSAAQPGNVELQAKTFLSLYKDYHVDRSFAKDIKINYLFVNGSIKEMEARDVSLTKYGPGYIADFQISAMGRKVFGLDKCSYASALLPAFISEMLQNPEKFQDGNAEFIDKIEKGGFLEVFTPFEIKNLVFENLMIDAGSGPLSLKELKSDFSMLEGKVDFTCAIADLLLSRSFILSTPDLEPLSEVVRDDMHLYGDLGVTLLSQNDPADMTVSGSLKEQTLGGVSGNLEMDVPKSLLLPDAYQEPGTGEQRIKAAALSVDDRGFIDFVLACKAALDYGDFAQVKNELLEELREQRNNSENNGGLNTRRTQDALVNLLEMGGTLDISLKPAKPVSADELGEIFDQLNPDEYSVTHRPRSDH
jgi:hypothetical protein